METPLASLKIEIGDVIQGKFLIIKKLGQGTCGIVYLVKSFKDSKVFFLKDDISLKLLLLLSFLLL